MRPPAKCKTSPAIQSKKSITAIVQSKLTMLSFVSLGSQRMMSDMCPSVFPLALFHNGERAYERFLLLGFGGTCLPLRRALESPIAIACLRLLTLRPECPECALPRLNSCNSSFTSVLADGAYLRCGFFRRIELFLRPVLFLGLSLAMRTSLFV